MSLFPFQSEKRADYLGAWMGRTLLYRKQLLIFRTLAGVGGGGMAVVGNVIVSDAVPLKSRGIYQGCEWILSFMSGGSKLCEDSQDQARPKVLLFVITSRSG